MKPEDRPTAEQKQAEADARVGGVACPHCGCKDFKSPHGWNVKEVGVFKKRQKVCRHCGKWVCNSREIVD